MRIRDGQPEAHETPLPLDPAASPGVQRPGVREPGSSGLADAGLQVVGVYDGTAAREALLAGSESDWQQAISEGMAADAARRQHYAATTAPLGASAGDQMDIPEVPAYTLPPPPLAGYPWSGDEPIG
jgi:hypothetical protein